MEITGAQFLRMAVLPKIQLIAKPYISSAKLASAESLAITRGVCLTWPKSCSQSDQYFPGRQFAITDRFLKGVEAYKGLSMFAGKQGDAVNHLQNDKAKDKVSPLLLPMPAWFLPFPSPKLSIKNLGDHGKPAQLWGVDETGCCDTGFGRIWTGGHGGC